MHNIMLRITPPEKENPSEETPFLIFSERAFKRINYWTHLAGQLNREVSGVGTIMPRHGGYYVEQAFLLQPTLYGSAVQPGGSSS